MSDNSDIFAGNNALISQIVAMLSDNRYVLSY